MNSGTELRSLDLEEDGAGTYVGTGAGTKPDGTNSGAKGAGEEL